MTFISRVVFVHYLLSRLLLIECFVKTLNQSRSLSSCLLTCTVVINGQDLNLYEILISCASATCVHCLLCRADLVIVFFFEQLLVIVF